MAHYNVPRGVRINFYRGHKPLSTLPRPRKSLHSWLSPRRVPGQQAGGNVCWHNFFSVAGLWCDVVSYNGSHVYVFCSSGFWKKTFTRPVQKTDLGSLSCLGYSSHVSFSIGLIYITYLLLSNYVLIISFFLPFFPLLFYHFSLSAVLSPKGRIMRWAVSKTIFLQSIAKWLLVKVVKQSIRRSKPRH